MPKRMEKSELKDFYKSEFKRSSKALDETSAKLKRLKESRIATPSRQFNIGKLEYAVYVGSIYVKTLEKKIKENTNT